jgi:hypothetical protein
MSEALHADAMLTPYAPASVSAEECVKLSGEFRIKYDAGVQEIDAWKAMKREGEEEGD